MTYYCAEYGGHDYTYRAPDEHTAEVIAEGMGWTYLGKLEDFFEVSAEMLAMIERDGETIH